MNNPWWKKSPIKLCVTPVPSSSRPPPCPFAFAFLPLFPDGRAFLEDGSHTLVLYRADRISQVTTDLYLTATPWLPANTRPEQVFVPADLQRLAPPMRDSLIVRSSLVSTKFTQNSVLLSLLNWEKLADKEVLQTVRPWAVDVSGGVELKDGSAKDPARVQAFIETVKSV